MTLHQNVQIFNSVGHDLFFMYCNMYYHVSSRLPFSFLLVFYKCITLLFKMPIITFIFDLKVILTNIFMFASLSRYLYFCFNACIALDILHSQLHYSYVLQFIGNVAYDI